MEQNSSKKTVNENLIGEIIVVISPVLVLVVYKLCKIFGIKTICIWKNLFGHNCWGCGMTTAVIAILKGDFQTAWNYNALSFIVFPLLLFLWVKYIYKHFIVKSKD